MAISSQPDPGKRERECLPNKRRAGTASFEQEGMFYTATGGFFPDGRLGELFLNHSHSDSLLDAVTSDGAIAVSLALQFGCPLATLRHAMKRDGRGVVASPIGAALDILGLLDNDGTQGEVPGDE